MLYWWDERIKGKDKNGDKPTFQPANRHVEARCVAHPKKRLLVSNSLPQGAKTCEKKGENLLTDVICISFHANEEKTNSAQRRKKQNICLTTAVGRAATSLSAASFSKKMPHGSRRVEQKGTLSANAIKLRRALIASRVTSCGAVGMKYGKRLNFDNVNVPVCIINKQWWWWWWETMKNQSRYWDLWF